jgi:GT2 family glycosyltransferase
MKPANQPRLGVVIVNYRRAADSIECLESLLRSTVPLRVVVVDNGSGDGSAEAIAAWAAGQQAPAPASAEMAAWSTPPLPKPLPCRQIGPDAIASTPEGMLTLINSPTNLGFAGGNNLGLRHLLGDPGLEAFWLLNNDTVVAPDAAAAILLRLDASPQAGMCGTVVRYYWRPGVVQALNGSRFNLYTGASASIGGGDPVEKSFSPQEVAWETDFVLGASMIVTRRFLDRVGLMEERYFLYYEEIDWATRNNKLGRKAFDTVFAHGAHVWHKEGGSIGSSGAKGQRSAFSDYWLARARLRFIRTHHPLLWPWHWLFTGLLVLRRLLRRQPRKAGALLRAMFGMNY